nr:tetratricopeptide repeat protein 38-like isoform X2 [Doryrhamphus excisus]XP_057920514.1 tetratricopeptide repeat protein 38-like isoform X2 [Doryrhamphus excisus]
MADPYFVMGHVVSAGVELVGTSTSPRLDERLARIVRTALELAKNQNITQREMLHVKALELFAQGNIPKASDVWEDILIEHPTDLLALAFANSGYYFTGSFNRMRDSIARVLPHWKPHIPLSRYLKGMYAFGLVETQCYDQSEKFAMEGLALVPDDAWSIHSLAHVYEMKVELDKGLKFMESREKDWQVSDRLAGHNYCHWSQYFIEKGQYEAALHMFDTEVSLFTHVHMNACTGRVQIPWMIVCPLNLV